MRETKTTCPYCGVGCGVVARVEGSVVSVEGDATHPANAGRLCVKGASLPHTIALEAPLRYPQLDGQSLS